MTMQDIRTNVASRITPGDDTVCPDILSDGATHDNIIRALDVITSPALKGAGDGSPSFGHKIYISALHRDHHDDGDLGPHGHNPHGAPGWACDIAIIDGNDVGNNASTRAFVSECLAHNKYITKVGTTASVANEATLQSLAAQHHTLLFVDEGDGPHVHIQSA